MQKVLLVLLIGALIACSQPASSLSVAELESRALEAANAALGSNVRVSAVRLVGSRITLDFNRSPDPEFLEVAVRASALALEGQFWHLEFAFTANQRPLSSVQPQALVCSGATMFSSGGPGAKPLSISGAKIVLNPGHGWSLRDDGVWGWQRPLVDLNASPPVYVQEDQNNLLMARAVRHAVAPSGATVLAVRNLDLDAGNGVSGKPKWQENARLYFESIGVVSGVWDSERDAKIRDCSEEKDIRARALYANAVAADALIGLHTNAGGSSSYLTARGTLTFYSTENFWSDAGASWSPDSESIARKVHQAVVETIRAARPDLNWPQGMVIGVPSGSFINYGELRFSKVPSVLVEVGFHTNPTDGPALGQPDFRAAVGRGVRAGLEAHFGAAVNTPKWVVNPTNLTLEPGVVGGLGADGSLTVSNGGASGTFTASSDNAFFTVTSNTSSVSASSSATVYVSAAACETVGIPSGTVTVSGGGSSAVVNVSRVCAAPDVPSTPDSISMAISSGGRVLLSWSEANGAAKYVFTGTFGGQPVVIEGEAPRGKTVRNAAVLAFDSNPSSPDKQGREVCVFARAVNLAGSSQWSDSVCTTYRYYALDGASVWGEPLPQLRMSLR